MSTSQPTRPPVWGRFQQDLLASFVVFLVALPLCMGVAIASGVPVTSGLISGVIGGMVVGTFAGCPLQVSGPAAGLTVIVFELGERLGLANLGLTVVVAGLLQIVAGVTGLGQWFRAVSPAVIRGMLAGIGFLILGGQFHAMFDIKPPGNGLVNLARIPETAEKGWASITLPDRAERKSRIQSLQTARRLLTDQTVLRQRARSAPERDATGEHAPITTAGEAGSMQSWSEIAAAQGRLAADLSRLAASLQTAHIDTGRAAELAAETAESAAREVEADPAEALAAISRATTATEVLLTRLKQPQFAGLIGLGTILVIVLSQELIPRRFQAFPPALIAVLAASIAAAWLQLPIYYVDVPDNLTTDIVVPTATTLFTAPWRLILQSGLLMAVVASAETLLCASAVDQMHRGPRTRYDKELWAQGIGNLLCGLVGALPLTGVIVRSSANVQSGGRTRLSTILHGVWLLVFITCLTGLLRLIPTSCLAAILVYTGYRLIDVRSIRELRVFGWGEVMIYAVTVTTIVFHDLLTGVLVGIALSAIKLLHTFSQLRTRLTIDDETQRAVLSLDGSATFIRLPKLASTLERVPPGIELHVDFQHLDFIDHACLELLMNWGTRHQETGGGLILDWETLHARFRRPDRNVEQVLS